MPSPALLFFLYVMYLGLGIYWQVNESLLPENNL